MSSPRSTIRLRLQLSGAAHTALDDTCVAYARACAHAAAVGRATGTTANARLHAVCYREIREQFGLSANLSVRAIARAAAALKEGDGLATFPPNGVDYDARVLSILPESGTVSLSTVRGRFRTIAAEAEGGGPVPLSATTFVAARLSRRSDGTYTLDLRLPLISRSKAVKDPLAAKREAL